MSKSEEGRVKIVNKKITPTESIINVPLSLIQYQSEFFRYSERIAEIGICHIYIEKKQIFFSDNLYRILGYQPNSFTPTLKSILQHIHTADKMQIKAILENNEESHKLHGSTLRLKTKDGDYKYVTLKNQVLNEKGERIIVIGLRDVTTQIAFEKMLTEKNNALSESNSQLLSFNQIAGHDLQEPLRKIQLYISQLQQSDEEQLSEKLNKYLQKIQITSERLQKLVIDLLNFSNISQKETPYENISLEKVVAEAIDEIEYDEKIVQIKADPLPIAAVIPIQFKQLFINLISNSLKFADNKRNSIINIKKEKIEEKDLKNYPETDPNDILKVSVEDNGIGFENKHAKNIFNSFIRLNNKSLFPGSGIGLAICKKIIDNHKGTIAAFGQPGVGAKFVFTIPLSQ